LSHKYLFYPIKFEVLPQCLIDMKKREPVANIMTSHVYSINLYQSLFEAKEIFNHKKVRHLPVTNGGGRLVGILSLTDIMRLSFGNVFAAQEEADYAVLEMLSIEQVMRHQPRTVSPDDTIKEAAEILANEEFHALPVVEDGRLVGIVTTTDVIKYLLEQY
jgi:predicted transcriptional regulator